MPGMLEADRDALDDMLARIGDRGPYDPSVELSKCYITYKKLGLELEECEASKEDNTKQNSVDENISIPKKQDTQKYSPRKPSPPKQKHKNNKAKQKYKPKNHG